MFADCFPADQKPYAIQEEFMRSCYACLQLGGVAMLESPTGTVHALLHLTVACTSLFTTLCRYWENYQHHLRSS